MHRTTNDRSRHRAHTGERNRRWSPEERWPIFMLGALFLATLACARPQSLRDLRSQSTPDLSTQPPSSVPPTSSATPSHTPTKVSTATQVPTPTPTPKVITEDNVEQIQPLYVLRGPTRGVTQVVISPDGKLVAASSLDGTIWLWRVSDGR
ncbi:MAG TPA: hypothetical protein G4O11_06690, partial [Anaerolineae bacterium]|nr:hypothetical protein [Anaerolineae bacterium]